LGFMREKSKELTGCGHRRSHRGHVLARWNGDEIGTTIGCRSAAIFRRGRGAEAERCGKVLLKICHGEVLDSSIGDEACAVCLLYRVGWIWRGFSCIKFRTGAAVSPMLHPATQEVHE